MFLPLCVAQHGTIRTLDDRVKSLDLTCLQPSWVNDSHCEEGLVSRDGWALIEDGPRPRLDSSQWQWSTGPAGQRMRAVSCSLKSLLANHAHLVDSCAELGPAPSQSVCSAVPVDQRQDCNPNNPGGQQVKSTHLQHCAAHCVRWLRSVALRWAAATRLPKQMASRGASTRPSSIRTSTSWGTA